MFKPMLAKDADLEKVKFPLYVQAKYDGIRALVVDGQLVSRTMKPIPNDEIREALSKPEFEGLDGEIIIGMPTDKDCFQRTTSFVRSKDKTGEPWLFYVFDKWNHGGTFSERRQWLLDWAEENVSPETKFVDVASTLVNDAAELEDFEQMLLRLGYEGAIARVPDALYKFGRSGKTGPLLKIKRFTDFEARILGVYEEMHNENVAEKDAFGRTKRSSHKDNKTGKGKVGGFELLAMNGPWEGVSFRCGTGLNHDLREYLWSYNNEDGGKGAIGLVVKVKAFQVGSVDKPRFPVFLGFREEFDR